MIDRHVQLGSLELFAGVPEALFSSPTSRTWPEDDAIIVQGEPSRGFVLLVSGLVDIVIDGQRIGDRHPIEILGELAVLQDQPHSATVIARSVATTLEYDTEQSNRLLEDQTFCQNLATDLAKKLRQATVDRGPKYMQLNDVLSSFRAHVNAEVADELIEARIDGSPTHVEATLLFVDVRGFTRLSSSMPPTEIADQLGEFLSWAVDVVHDSGGVVDKFIGDALMGWWVGGRDERHAERAVSAALRIESEAKNFMFGGEPIKVGAGLESGLVFLGTIGNGVKRQHTALGSVVNTAARLQSMSADLGGLIAIGPGTFNSLPSEIQATFSGPQRIAPKGLEAIDVWIK